MACGEISVWVVSSVQLSPVENLPGTGMESSVWEALAPSSFGLPDSEPAGRCGHVAVSSRDGQRLIVFGGYNPEGILSDVWEFHLERREWERVNIAVGPSPPQRTYFRGCAGPPPLGVEQGQHRPVEDEVEGVYMYVFGGIDAEGNETSDVWCLDVENRTWHEVHQGQGQQQHYHHESFMGEVVPRPRSNHAMCRAGEILAVHGGECSSGASLEDLWFFRPASASWREAANVSSTGGAAAAGPRPSRRSSHCLAFASRCVEGAAPSTSSSASTSALAGSLVLFGGLGRVDTDDGDDESGFEEEAVPLNDLWVLSLSIATADALVSGSDGSDGEEAGEVTFSLGGVWSLVVVDGVGPSPRSLAAIASPGQPGGNNGGDLFFFGGYGLVELGSSEAIDGAEEEEEEGGEIILAYIDDLWRLSLASYGAGGAGQDSQGDSDVGAGMTATKWANEADMGFMGESIVEGRNGHTLIWCGDKLVLFGGFVGDSFDAGVHVAEPPSSLE